MRENGFSTQNTDSLHEQDSAYLGRGKSIFSGLYYKKEEKLFLGCGMCSAYVQVFLHVSGSGYLDPYPVLTDPDLDLAAIVKKNNF